jgi:hypothetical protein
MSNKLIYAPNIHLFAYHLQTNKNPNLLYEKCDEILGKLNIPDFNLKQRVNLSKELETLRVDLLKEEEIKNDNPSPPFEGNFHLDNQTLKFEGFAYPLRIHDTYSLALNIRRPEEENNKTTEYVNLSILEKFNPENCLSPDFIASSLGQTLVITVWLPEEQRQQYCEAWQLPDDQQKLRDIDFKTLADECLKSFLPASQKPPQLQGNGQLFGSPIFEYSSPSDGTTNQHILVWLFCTQETDKKLADCYQDLIDLFGYRNKIIQSYRDSRKVYKLLEQDYKQIEQEIDEFEQLTKADSLSEADLQQLQNQLKNLAKIASSYAHLLRDLEEQKHTISINTRNYKEKVWIIKKKIGEEYSSFLGQDLSFLERFSSKNCRRFQEQIQASLGYCVPGSNLVNQAIASIRGIVEIEQARISRQQEINAKEERKLLEIEQTRQKEAEQKLQNSIAAIGTGIAAGSFFASSSGLMTTPWKMPWEKNHTPYPHPFLISLLLSTLIALVVWWCVKQRQKIKSQKSDSSK